MLTPRHSLHVFSEPRSGGTLTPVGASTTWDLLMSCILLRKICLSLNTEFTASLSGLRKNVKFRILLLSSSILAVVVREKYSTQRALFPPFRPQEHVVVGDVDTRFNASTVNCFCLSEILPNVGCCRYTIRTEEQGVH